MGEIKEKYIHLSYNGCNGCCYNYMQGAKLCNHSLECMAHLRKDKKSVIFKFKK